MITSRPSLFTRLLFRSAAFLAALLVTAVVVPRAHALTNASLLPVNLAGKTLRFTITQGTAPFETSGNFDVNFTSTTAYNIPVSDGNSVARAGTYTHSTFATTTTITFNGYTVNNATVIAEIITNTSDIRSQFEMYSAGPFNKNGVVSFASGSGSGGSTGAPAITSATTATATVGSAFTYQIAATNSPTSYTNAGGNAPIAISPGSGLVTGTFTAVGVYNFSYTATNASGTSAVTTVNVTVTAGSGAVPAITSASTASSNVGGSFTYQITGTNSPTTYAATSLAPGLTVNTSTGLITGSPTTAGTYQINITAGNSSGNTTGRLTLTVASPPAPSITSSAALNGTVGTPFSYAITALFQPTSFRLTSAPTFLSLNTTTGLVTGTPTAAGTYAFTVTAINATGSGSRNVTLTVAAAANTVTTAPLNLTGYRNRVGQTFQFTVTGALAGAVWGTDVYTDDSSVASAAIHAGVLRLGETRTVTITILAGQGSYSASTRNGVTTSNWGSWGGSYSFAGAGAVTTTDVATAVPAAAPGFVAASTGLALGGRFVCPVTVRGGGTYTYRWYLNGVLIPGATTNPYVVDSVSAANAGTYAADVTNALGTARITAGSLAVGAAGIPVFSLQPFNKVVAPGGTFALAAEASGTGNTYQWLRNGVALSGENGPILLRQSVNSGDAGTYAVRVTNASGTVTSANSVVTLNENAAVIANISVRTATTAGQIVTPAFTIAGTGKKRVLIRASGPALTQFGLSGVMADPKFDVYDGSTRINGNDNWDAAIAPAAAAVGAFPFPVGSKDAGLVVDLDASASGKGYTVQVTGAANTAGVVLVEVYDLGNPSGASKLTNVSVLSKADTGASTLILGLFLKGEGQRTLLVRGIGPKLASFGVGGLLTDPKLQVFDSDQRSIITNNDWAGADFVSELVQASGFVGAFPLDNNTADSATLALLQPGSTYTVQVTGNDGGTGNAIIEVYEVP